MSKGAQKRGSHQGSELGREFPSVFLPIQWHLLLQKIILGLNEGQMAEPDPHKLSQSSEYQIDVDPQNE